MKYSGNIFIAVAIFVICAALFCGSAQAEDYNALESRVSAGILNGSNIIVTALYIAGALGVILTGLHMLRLAGAITSIARLLDNEKDGSADNCELSMLSVKKINELRRDINERLAGRDSLVARYDKQIEELKIQLQISQKRETNIEEIIYSIRDAVIVVDEFDKLLMANGSAGRLLSFDYKNSRFKPVRELISADRSEFLNFLSNARKSRGQAARKEIKFVDDDRPKIFDCIVSYIHDNNQQVCGAVAVLHDITREKEISNMKNDFISHVSHELKTPLASITAYSEMLADDEAHDEETRKEFYAVIQNQAQRLNRLIEDILNTSRIESGLIKINKEYVSLAILIEEQLKMIKGYADEKSIEIIGQRPIVFDQVYVDRDMMSQVIVNLLSNAVKYTRPGGSVKIKTEIDDAESMIRVLITDTGVGIPEDEIEHVFDKYYRVETNKKQAQGTGLGLNLVKQIVEKVHNGRVFVKSRVGTGSTFGFELPLAVKNTAATA
ncbi:MAG: PAS domain-containing protein [Sedimentisphaerales bacterium]|nr:PAS domain-containing protein [Sedimentisphaerales bacterium]